MTCLLFCNHATKDNAQHPHTHTQDEELSEILLILFLIFQSSFGFILS